MNERERFRAALLFNKPDKVPLAPGSPRESTLAAWHQQGLPEGVAWYEYLMEMLGIPYEPPTQSRVDLGVDFKMMPTFEEKVLEHRDGHYIVQDWMGAITEISDEYDYTYIREPKDFVTRHWHSFPVQSRRDWEEKIDRIGGVDVQYIAFVADGTVTPVSEITGPTVVALAAKVGQTRLIDNTRIR